MSYKIKMSKMVNDNFIDEILKLEKSSKNKKLYQNILSVNKESFILVYKDKKIVGYICFTPITKRLSNDILNVNFSIEKKDICSYSLKKQNDIYIASCYIKEEDRDSEAIRLLTNSFMKFIKEKIDKNYALRNVLVVALNRDVRRLFTNLNFKESSKNGRKVVMMCGSKEVRSIHFHKTYKDDIFIMIPFAGVGNIREKEDEDISRLYIDSLYEFSDYECHNSFVKTLKRKYLGKKEVGLIDDYYTKEVLEKEDCYLFITSHLKTNLHILTIVIPNNTLSTSMLEDQASSNNFFIYDKGVLVNIVQYVEKKYHIKKCGEPRSVVCLSKKPDNINEFKAIIASEAFEGEYNLKYNQHFINSKNLDDILANDISQYAFYEAYASEVAVVCILETFSENFKDNLEYEALLLFIIELILFQNASINRANKRIVESLSSGDKVSLKFLEDLYSELGKTTIFWNNDNFYYNTSQNFANNLNKSFKTDEKFAEYQKNQNFLENIINLKNAQSSNRENIILNAIVILLTILQVLPVILDFISWLQESPENINNVTMYGLPNISAFILTILLIILIRQSNKKTL